MPFPRKLLHRDEEIVLDLNPHPIYIFPASVVLVAALGLGVFVLTRDIDGTSGDIARIAAGVVVLAALVFWVVRAVEWRTTEFAVTTDRCIYRTGMVAKQGIEIPLDRINTIHFSQSVFERLIRAGDLTIESAAERGAQKFSDIRRPSAVQNVIYQQIEDNENRKFDRVSQGIAGNQPQAPAAAPPGISEQIQELNQLRGQGLLTDAEFQAKKEELLRRM